MKSSKSTLGEERLRVIEQKLVDIVANFGYLKGRSAKTSQVMAYIYIRKEVTQQQLREFTGHSLGTVSAALQDLEALGFVNKHSSPNLRSYIYTLSGPLSQILSQSMTGFQDYLSQINDFLKEVEVKLNKPSLSKKQGYSHIRSFLDEMNVLIPAYQHILQNFQTARLDYSQEKAGAASDQ
jgi:DNA-binding transcriptional regulator GbsR (MarR family)